MQVVAISCVPREVVGENYTNHNNIKPVQRQPDVSPGKLH